MNIFAVIQFVKRTLIELLEVFKGFESWLESENLIMMEWKI